MDISMQEEEVTGLVDWFVRWAIMNGADDIIVCEDGIDYDGNTIRFEAVKR